MLPLHQCEQTIQRIVDEYQQQPTPALKTTILLEWRKKLAQEPACLPVHDLDWLMQEVQRRVKASSR